MHNKESEKTTEVGPEVYQRVSWPTKSLVKQKRLQTNRSRFCFQLPRQGSNLDSSDPESDVLPVTPRGNEFFCRLYRRSSGAEGGRTPDLCIANAALSQLSYSPRHNAPPDSRGGERTAQKVSRHLRQTEPQSPVRPAPQPCPGILNELLRAGPSSWPNIWLTRGSTPGAGPLRPGLP